MARGIANNARIAFALSFALLGSASLARAENRDPQRAQELFDEARALLKQEKYAEACPKLQESQALDPGGGTLLNLGICHLKQGRTATAFSELNRALAQARADGRVDRQRTAEKHLSALERELSRLTVKLPASASERDLLVELDGSRLDPQTFGVETPIDPGVHQLQAKQAGYRPWSITLNIAPTRDRQVVEIPSMEPEPIPLAEPVPAVPSAASASKASAALPAPAVKAAAHDEFGSRRWLGVASLAVGAVALGVGSYFGLHAYSLKRQSNSAFDGTHCTQQSCVDDWDGAKRAAVESTVSMAVGLAAVGLGAYLVLAPARHPSDAGTAKLSIASAPSGAVLTFHAQF